MLNDKRIKEAEKNVKLYLEEELLKKIKPHKKIIDILVQNTQESLIEGERTKSSLWKIVISYYSMFYITNAVLVKLGYKVGEKIAHKVTSDALIVYVRNKLSKELIKEFDSAQNEALSGIKADQIVELFDFERSKRGTFQYSTTETAKKTKAETSLKRAKDFVLAMRTLL